MLVVPDFAIRLLGQVEHGVFHAMRVVLQRPVKNVRDKKIANWVLVR
jgi:hypothetical protein